VTRELQTSNTEIVNPDLDVVRIWQLYCVFQGDCGKAARAALVPVSQVVSLAHDYHWAAKLNGSGSTGDPTLDKEINRGANLVQAQRLREILETITREIFDEQGKFHTLIPRALSEDGKNAPVISKTLLELVKAAEVVQNMSYRALGDTATAATDTISGRKAVSSPSRDVIHTLSDRMKSRLGSPGEVVVEDAISTVTSAIP